MTFEEYVETELIEQLNDEDLEFDDRSSSPTIDFDYTIQE
jgi:hypothetical protein